MLFLRLSTDQKIVFVVSLLAQSSVYDLSLLFLSFTLPYCTALLARIPLPGAFWQSEDYCLCRDNCASNLWLHNQKPILLLVVFLVFVFFFAQAPWLSNAVLSPCCCCYALQPTRSFSKSVLLVDGKHLRSLLEFPRPGMAASFIFLVTVFCFFFTVIYILISFSVLTLSYKQRSANNTQRCCLTLSLTINSVAWTAFHYCPFYDLRWFHLLPCQSERIYFVQLHVLNWMCERRFHRSNTFFLFFCKKSESAASRFGLKLCLLFPGESGSSVPGDCVALRSKEHVRAAANALPCTATNPRHSFFVPVRKNANYHLQLSGYLYFRASREEICVAVWRRNLSQLFKETEIGSEVNKH